VTSRSFHRTGAFLAVCALASLAATLPADRWPAAIAFGLLLLAISWMDLRSGIVHAALALPLGLGGALAAWLTAPALLPAALAGAALGYIGFRLVETGFRHLRGHDGLGRGDSWVLGGAAAWVGPGGLGFVIAGAAAIALLAVLLRDRGFAPKASLPFAPALACASWVVWIAAGGAPSWTLP
jgi:leader peptidase (prepilin peptidase)/N-methyltransferase